MTVLWVKLIASDKGENYFPQMCLFDYFFSFDSVPQSLKIHFSLPQVSKLLYR